MAPAAAKAMPFGSSIQENHSMKKIRMTDSSTEEKAEGIMFCLP